MPAFAGMTRRWLSVLRWTARYARLRGVTGIELLRRSFTLEGFYRGVVIYYWVRGTHDGKGVIPE